MNSKVALIKRREHEENDILPDNGNLLEMVSIQGIEAFSLLGYYTSYD